MEEADQGESSTRADDSNLPSKKRKGRRRTTGLSSLQDLEQKVEAEYKDGNDLSDEFSEEQVQIYFEKLTEAANPGALKSVLSHVKNAIKNGELFLYVDSLVEKTTLLQEVWVIQDLRQHFGNKKLKVNIELNPDRSVKEEILETPKTKKEILEEFLGKSKSFKVLKETLKLKFDK